MKKILAAVFLSCAAPAAADDWALCDALGNEDAPEVDYDMGIQACVRHIDANIAKMGADVPLDQAAAARDEALKTLKRLKLYQSTGLEPEKLQPTVDAADAAFKRAKDALTKRAAEPEKKPDEKKPGEEEPSGADKQPPGGGPDENDPAKTLPGASGQKPPEEVKREAEKKLAANPGDLKALEERSRARAQTGDVAGAVADARRVLEKDPQNALALFVVGNRDQLARSGSKLKGLKLDFGAAPQMDGQWQLQSPKRPQNPPAGAAPAPPRSVAYTPMSMPPLARKLHDSARRKLGLGDATGALAEAGRAISEAPDNAELLLLRAQIHRVMNEPQKARADADAALALAPDDPHALRERALAQIQLGNFEAALADLERAIELQPSNGTSWLYKAMALEKLGRREEALAAAARAVELDPALKPLAAPLVARLKGAQANAPRAAAVTVRRVKAGAVALALVFLLCGLAGTARGRALVTTTAKTLLGRAQPPDTP